MTSRKSVSRRQEERKGITLVYHSSPAIGKYPNHREDRFSWQDCSKMYTTDNYRSYSVNKSRICVFYGLSECVQSFQNCDSGLKLSQNLHESGHAFGPVEVVMGVIMDVIIQENHVTIINSYYTTHVIMQENHVTIINATHFRKK